MLISNNIIFLILYVAVFAFSFLIILQDIRDKKITLGLFWIGMIAGLFIRFVISFITANNLFYLGIIQLIFMTVVFLILQRFIKIGLGDIYYLILLSLFIPVFSFFNFLGFLKIFLFVLIIELILLKLLQKLKIIKSASVPLTPWIFGAFILSYFYNFLIPIL